MQYLWEQLIKWLTYNMDLANRRGGGGVRGCQLPPPPLGSDGWQPTFPSQSSPYMSAQAYTQAAAAAGTAQSSTQAAEPAGTTGQTVEDLIKRVNVEDLSIALSLASWAT